MCVREALREQRPIVIVDIDGTLVNNAQRRHLVPKDDLRNPHAWTPFNMACKDDAPIMQNIITVKALIDGGFLAIFVSSRGQVAKQATADQLVSIGLVPVPLVLRPMDEPRKPSEWKAAVLDDIEAYYGYKITAAIDDDPTVCQMMRERGIAVVQVSTRCSSIA